MSERLPTEPTTAVLNVEALRRLQDLAMPGEPSPIVELIELYLADAPTCLDQLRLAFGRKDACAVQRLAHSLRGSSTNLGVERLASLCASLEQQAQRDDFAPARGALAEIEDAFRNAVEALERERENARDSVD
jgi:two-component system, sensor histidine kinase